MDPTFRVIALLGALPVAAAAAREPLPQPAKPGSVALRAPVCSDVRDFGAVADFRNGSGHDNTRAFQAAADAAVRDGRSVCVPAGAYFLSAGVKIDQSNATDDATPRPSIIGDGDGTTRLVFGPGDFAGITYIGGWTGAGPHVYAEIRGLRLEKSDRQGSALRLTRVAFLSIARVTALGWHTGLEGTDILLSSVRDTTLRWNEYGVMLARGNFSHPNAITFADARIANNAECGILARNPTTLSVEGGEIGGNGVGGRGDRRGGVVVDGGPLEGGVGLVADHVYFEANTGQADVLILSEGAPSVHAIRASTFNRTSATDFAENMIKVVGSALVKVSLDANAFKRFGTYKPSPDRPYVDMSGATHPGSILALTPTNLMDDPETEGHLRAAKAQRP